MSDAIPPTPPTGDSRGAREDASAPQSPSPVHPLSPSEKRASFLLKSPFAKMFRAAGADPTIKQMQGIINGILKQQISAIKKNDKRWKEAMRKMKKAIRGE